MSSVQTHQFNRRWRLLAAFLILGSAAIHVAYLCNHCPLDLSPDEAHYWDWSRHLEWSYYSKGPLVAYLIRAGCVVAGTWSDTLIDNQMIAVRLPAVICGAMLLVSLYILTLQVFGDEKLACGVVALALPLPLVTAGSTLMTIDAPYTCCWGWALVVGHRAIFRRSSWAWPALGLIIGAGILAKYTMLLWIPSAGCFLLQNRRHRQLLVSRSFWGMVLIAATCCIPVLYWNAQHDWVSLRHVGGQAGLRDTTGFRLLGPLEYLGTQFALLLGFWFVAWAGAMIAHAPWREANPDNQYLWWLSAPMFVVFWAFSIRTPEEPNWPVTAYLSGMVLAGGWLGRCLDRERPRLRRLTIAALGVAACLGFAVSVVMHHSDWVQPALLRLSGSPTSTRPIPLRRFDPTCRLRGWNFLARSVDEIRTQLRSKGIEPVLAAGSWTTPGELAFYCQGHPVVYSLGLGLGERHSQYDLWRPNPLADQDAYVGKTFVFVGELTPVLRAGFERVEESRTITYCESEQPVARWTVTICRGYRGLDVTSALARTTY